MCLININSNLAVWQCWTNDNKGEALFATIQTGHIGVLFVYDRYTSRNGIFYVTTTYQGYVSQGVGAFCVSNSTSSADLFTASATNDYVVTITPKNDGLRGWFIVK